MSKGERNMERKNGGMDSRGAVVTGGACVSPSMPKEEIF